MPNLDITQFAVLAAIIVGVNELLVRLRAKDLWAVATIVAAALIGLLFGAIHYYPTLDWASGLAVGFGAVGFLKTLSTFGNKSTPAPNADLVTKEPVK